MRSRSLAAPLLLVVLGGLFLWRNLHPETPIFDILAMWWPFLLIAWGLLRLLEVLVWRASRQAGLSAGEILLVVLICVAGMGLFEINRHGIHLTPEIFGEQFEFPVQVGAPAGGSTRIVFENPRGAIHLNGADTQEIRISGHKLIRAYKREDAERTDEQTPVEIVPQGDRVLVTSHQERAPADERVSDELDITVPRSMAIEAYGGSADYEITDINGDVALGGPRGDVRLARVKGNVRLEVGRSETIAADTIQGNLDIEGRGSDIDIQNVTGQVTVNGAYVGSLAFKNVAMALHLAAPRMEVQAAAVPGSINMDLGDFSATNLVGPVRLVTQSRDVHLAGFTDSLNLESVRGDVELQPGRVPLPRIDAHSSSGAVELLLPEKAEFQLQAMAEHGDAVNDFGAPIETQVEGRAAVLRGAQGNGPLIRIIADRGSVAVRKQGSSRGVEATTSPNTPAPPALPAQPALPAPPVRPAPPAPVNLKDSEVKL